MLTQKNYATHAWHISIGSCLTVGPIQLFISCCRQMHQSKKQLFFLKKNGPNSASFCLFSFFSHDKYRTNLTIKDKSIDGVLGAQTRGGRMVGPDESTELWWHPLLCITYICKMMLIGRLIVIGAFESSSQGLSIRQCYSSPV